MKYKPSRVGAEFADEYLGHEENIVMNVEDARYRYFQWLRGWYGLGKTEVTNKCPFYQFMFWGSLVMLGSIVPIIIRKIIDIFVLWPLSWIAPDFVDDFNDATSKNKMVSSWFITIILVVIATIVGTLLSSPILAWVGLVVHWIYAVPILALGLTWYAVVFLATDVIPWIFSGIGWVLEAIFTAIIAFINFPWLSVLLWALGILGVIVAFSLTIIILYKLGVWFFKSSFTKWAIKKSCDVREFRIMKHRKHKVLVHRRKEEKQELKMEKAAKKKRKEPGERLDKILLAAFPLIWAGLIIFPGYPFKWIGHVFMWVIEAIIIVCGCLGWFFGKIWDVIVVIWSLVFETISNHCPPIDFVVEINEIGKLIPRSGGNFKFTSKDLDNDIYISLSDLPDNFKPSTLKSGRGAVIRCTIRKFELEQSKRIDSNPDVYKIQNLGYIPYPTTRKK